MTRCTLELVYFAVSSRKLPLALIRQKRDKRPGNCSGGSPIKRPEIRSTKEKAADGRGCRSSTSQIITRNDQHDRQNSIAIGSDRMLQCRVCRDQFVSQKDAPRLHCPANWVAWVIASNSIRGKKTIGMIKAVQVLFRVSSAY